MSCESVFILLLMFIGGVVGASMGKFFYYWRRSRLRNRKHKGDTKE